MGASTCRDQAGSCGAQGQDGGLGGEGSSHSPLLAFDVVLLHRVAEEGGPGARDDPWLPGVHIEGVREPWGRERRGESRGVRQVEVLVPGIWGPCWQVKYLGESGRICSPTLGDPLC